MSQLFDFSTFPTLTTERLRLRQLTVYDADAIIALLGAPDMLRYISQPAVDTREKAMGLLDWFDGNYQRHESVQWGITLHDDFAMIGTCGTYAWDRENRHVDLGYFILPSHWGKGYATEATHAMIRWCFDKLDVHRIQADCTEGNIASERVLLKCGFQVEGVTRESCWEHRRFVNIKMFGLLRQEYPFE